jgi:hypothetical protein
MQKCSYSDRVVPLRSGHPSCNKKSGVIRKMMSCEGDNLVVFYYLIESTQNNGGYLYTVIPLFGLIRPSLLSGQ